MALLTRLSSAPEMSVSSQCTNSLSQSSSTRTRDLGGGGQRLHHFFHVLHHGADTGAGQPQRPRSCVQPQNFKISIDHRHQAIGLAKDGGGRFPRGRRVWITHQQLREALNGDERRAQLMRDKTQRFRSRLVALAAGGDVFSNQQQRAGFSKRSPRQTDSVEEPQLFARGNFVFRP